MRFFEYEAREIVKRAGIPVTDYGFTRDPHEARQIAERIGGPVVIKSQVLSGGRKIGVRGAILFWFVPSKARSLSAPPAFRQDRRLDAREIAFFHSLTESLRSELSFEKINPPT